MSIKSLSERVVNTSLCEIFRYPHDFDFDSDSLFENLAKHPCRPSFSYQLLAAGSSSAGTTVELLAERTRAPSTSFGRWPENQKENSSRGFCHSKHNKLHFKPVGHRTGSANRPLKLPKKKGKNKENIKEKSNCASCINLWCSFSFLRQVYADEAKWKISKKSNKQLKRAFYTLPPTSMGISEARALYLDFSTYQPHFHVISFNASRHLDIALQKHAKSQWLNTCRFAHTSTILRTPFVARSLFLNGN